MVSREITLREFVEVAHEIDELVNIGNEYRAEERDGKVSPEYKKVLDSRYDEVMERASKKTKRSGGPE